MIQLHGIRVSRAGRCLWMLEELGVPYENVPVDFLGGSRTTEFRKLNPNGRVPVLEDGATVLFESLAINLYLARKYGGAKGLWPKDVADEGRLFQWSLWAANEIETPLVTLFVHTVMFPPPQRDAKLAEEARGKLPAPLAVLDDALRGRKYLLGDTFTAADLNVASVCMVMPLMSFDLGPYPHLADWLKRCLERPAAQKARG